MELELDLDTVAVAAVKRGRGRPKTGAAKRFDTVGLTPEMWQYLEGWKLPGEGSNMTPALCRALEALQRYVPVAELGQAASAPRGPGGRFLKRS